MLRTEASLAGGGCLRQDGAIHLCTACKRRLKDEVVTAEDNTSYMLSTSVKGNDMHALDPAAYATASSLAFLKELSCWKLTTAHYTKVVRKVRQ